MGKNVDAGGVSFRKLPKDLTNHVQETRNSALTILLRLPKKPTLVADIGAGYGGLAINLGLLGSKVHAIEPEQDQRKVMKLLITKYPKINKKISIVKGVGEKIPLRNNFVDLCILSQVLEHVKNPNETVREVSRILKSGGYLHLSSPNYLFPQEQHLHIPYLPLMNKSLFQKRARIYLKMIKHKARRGDFPKVKSFISSTNYTTDMLIRDLCKKHKFKIIWSSSSEAKDLAFQIKRHWKKILTSNRYSS